MSENKLPTEILLEDRNEKLKRLDHTHLSSVPNKGDLYLDSLDKIIYEINEVIHSDLQLILIVRKSEINSSEICSLIY